MIYNIKMEGSETRPEYLGYMITKLHSFENLSYFVNIHNIPAGNFLLGIYNIDSIMKEHQLHLAVLMTKFPNATDEKYMKDVTKVMYANMNNANGKSRSELFVEFLKQFKTDHHNDRYYKKFSITS